MPENRQNHVVALQDLQEPESEDPKQWTPPELAGLALMYGYGVDALLRMDRPGWAEQAHLSHDILFNRDMLQEWLDLFDDEAFEEIIETEAADIPLPYETDQDL